MRVFLTGATGFIGSRILGQLQEAGHEVLGLTRSEAGERALIAAGAMVHRGTIDDPDSLRAGASMADAVIHTAFDHNFDNFLANCEQDARVITILGEALANRGPLIITSGTAMGERAPGVPATEDFFNIDAPNPRKMSEMAAQSLIDAGHDVRVIRLPQVHDTQRQGLLNGYIAWTQANGKAVYIGDGANRWAAGHVDDVARLYVLALERGISGHRYHAVGEEGVRALDAVTIIAEKMGVPMVSVDAQDAPNILGWLAMFVGTELPASSALTRERLGWKPMGPKLMEDLRSRNYVA